MTNKVNEKELNSKSNETLEESDIPSDSFYRSSGPIQKVNTLEKPQLHVPGSDQPVEYIANNSPSEPVVRPQLEARNKLRYDPREPSFAQVNKKIKDAKKELLDLSRLLTLSKKDQQAYLVDKIVTDIMKLEKELTYSYSEGMELEELMAFLHEDLEDK
jgi:hypothetical protein